jgi:hypothetical protein
MKVYYYCASAKFSPSFFGEGLRGNKRNQIARIEVIKNK